MRQMKETWAVVLAGGTGRRLRAITTNREGVEIPKQFCSLEGRSCLLQNALTRAASVALTSHVCTVVAAQHRQWWVSAVRGLNDSNVIVQPHNKGTAVGILLALLTIERRNPAATLILLPADHYFHDEDTISRALRKAANLASANPACTFLLGVDPERADSELGYILPEEKVCDKPAAITGFTEKPTAEYAQELIALGALWNLFILVGSVKALLELFAHEHAELVSKLRAALARSVGAAAELQQFYQTIEPIDFSREVLEVHAHRLQVVRVPHCGWNDLGTPQRVEATVRGIETRAGLSQVKTVRSPPLFCDLGALYSQFQGQPVSTNLR